MKKIGSWKLLTRSGAADHANCVPDGRQVRWCSQRPWSDILVGCGVWAGLVGAPPLGLRSWCSVSSCNGFSPFVFKTKKKHRKNVNMGANEHSILKTSKLFLLMG